MITKNIMHIQLKVSAKKDQNCNRQQNKIISVNRNILRAFLKMDKIHSQSSVKQQKQPTPTYKRQRLLTISPLVIHPMYDYLKSQKSNTIKLQRQIHRKCYTLNSDYSKYPSSITTNHKNDQQPEQILRQIQFKASIQELRQKQLSTKQSLYDQVKTYNQSNFLFNNLAIEKEGQTNKLNQIRSIFKKHKQGQSLVEKVKIDQKYPILRYSAQELKHIKAQSYIIVEYPTNSVILKYRASINLQIASLTKIMTFYTTYKIIIQNQIDIKNQTVIASKDVNYISGTSAEIIEGQTYTIQELLYGLMLPSGNDAANQLANWGGSIIGSNKSQTRKRYFVAQMNKQANLLKMNKTRFMNPHGLPNNQAKSTADDLAKLCCACMKIQLFREIVSCKQYHVKKCNQNNTRYINWKNTNKLLQIDGFMGIKTGITVTAGPCLAAAYKFNDKIYISILLGAAKMADRFNDTKMLLRWSLSKLHPTRSQLQQKMLNKLRVNKKNAHESSQQQLQFAYDCKDNLQYEKRCLIVDQTT